MTDRDAGPRCTAPGWGLLLAPLPAVAVGLVVLSSAGLPASTWMANGAAAVVGVLGAGAVGAWRRPAGRSAAPLSWLLPLGLALVGATLVTPGMEGVRR